MAALATVSACKPLYTPSGAASDAAVDGAMAAAPPAPKLDLALQGEGTSQSLYLVNREDVPVLIKRIVLNDLPEDKDCALKVFETLRKGEGRTTAVGTCGTVLKVSVETDRGTYDESWDPTAGKLSATIYDTYVDVQNQSTDALRLNRLVLNGREGDSHCDIKVFESINPKDTTSIQNTGNCGRINSYRIYVTYKGEDMTFDFKRPPQESDAASM